MTFLMPANGRTQNPLSPGPDHNRPLAKNFPTEELTRAQQASRCDAYLPDLRGSKRRKILCRFPCVPLILTNASRTQTNCFIRQKIVHIYPDICRSRSICSRIACCCRMKLLRILCTMGLSLSPKLFCAASPISSSTSIAERIVRSVVDPTEAYSDNRSLGSLGILSSTFDDKKSIGEKTKHIPFETNTL